MRFAYLDRLVDDALDKEEDMSRWAVSNCDQCHGTGSVEGWYCDCVFPNCGQEIVDELTDQLEDMKN